MGKFFFFDLSPLLLRKLALFNNGVGPLPHRSASGPSCSKNPSSHPLSPNLTSAPPPLLPPVESPPHLGSSRATPTLTNLGRPWTSARVACEPSVLSLASLAERPCCRVFNIRFSRVGLSVLNLCSPTPEASDVRLAPHRGGRAKQRRLDMILEKLRNEFSSGGLTEYDSFFFGVYTHTT